MRKKLFYILSGYAIGSVISSLYTDKKGSELRKDLEKAKQAGKNMKKLLFSNFIHIQKKFFNDMQEKVLTEERQDFIDTKREELEKLVAKYKEEGEELVKTLQKKGKIYASDISARVEEFFSEKLEEGKEKLQQFGETITEEFKEEVSKASKEIKKKIK